MKDFLQNYYQRMGQLLLQSPIEQLEKAAQILLAAREANRWIFAAGNGGSAATASHFTNDFVKGLSVEGKKRFKVVSLVDCVPVLTALSNDYAYGDCFVEQLKNYGAAGDVLVAYSGSGNSMNVVNAAQYARSIHMKVIAFTGRDGGQINAYCDVNVIAPTDVMEEIEDIHMVWEHAYVLCLRGMLS